jgi:hypothetical protein
MLHSVILLVLVLQSCSLQINIALKIRHAAHSVPRKRRKWLNQGRGSRSGIGTGIIGSTPCDDRTRVRRGGFALETLMTRPKATDTFYRVTAVMDMVIGG